MVSVSPPVVTHTISANSAVIAPAIRLILSLQILPEGVRMPLSIRGFVDVFIDRPPLILVSDEKSNDFKRFMLLLFGITYILYVTITNFRGAK